MKTATYKKLYALVVILLPVLCQYNIAGGMIDYDVIAMGLIFILGILGRIHSKQYFIKHVWLIIFYTVIITSINLLMGTDFSDEFSVLMRAGRYCLYMYIVLIQNIDFFDYTVAMIIYKRISYLALFYIVIQAAFYYGAGITLPNTIGGETTSIYTNTSIEIGRLRAFYSEPAAMTYALVPFIVCSLFGEPYQRIDRRVLDAALISGAVILSTSGQGILCVIVLWGIWVIRQSLSGKMKRKTMIVMIVLLIAAIFIFRTSLMEFALGRVFSTDRFGATSARASGYKTFILLKPLQVVFGSGYGNYVTENSFGLDVPYPYVNYSSLAEHIFTTGIVGTLIVFFLIQKKFSRGNFCEKALIIAIAVLAVGGAPLTGTFFPIYLSLLFCNKDGSYRKELEWG